MAIQIILTIFILLALSRVIDRFWRKEMHAAELIVWLTLWVVAGVVVLWPSATSYLASVLGVGRGSDLVLYIAVMLLFYLAFRMSVKFEKMDRQITKLTRIIALKDVETKKDEKTDL